MEIIFRYCLFVIIWCGLISWIIGVSILFNRIDVNAMIVIPENYYPDPIGDPDLMTIINFILPVLIGLALSMRLFNKELTKKGDEPPKHHEGDGEINGPRDIEYIASLNDPKAFEGVNLGIIKRSKPSIDENGFTEGISEIEWLKKGGEK